MDNAKIKKRFQLLIKPVNADCNLACSYCFYRPKYSMFGLGPHRMSYELLDRIISEYLGYGFNTSVFIWQGGEPTMAGLEFFERAVELEIKHGRSGQTVGNALQTNCILIDDAWADFLHEYKFLVGASLDGPREIHDASRRTPSGGGTFHRVMNSINLLRKRSVAVNIISVVSRANVDKAREVYRFFRNEGFTDLQFIPCLERDSSGKPADFCATPRQYGRFLCDLYDEWIENGFPKVALRTFDSMLACAAGLGGTLCTFSSRCGAYILIEHNGDVYPCDFFVEPKWKIGNVTEAPLVDFFGREKETEFLGIKSNPASRCTKCRWWKFCHGGCPKDWIDSEGNPADKTYFCKSYRILFNHLAPLFKHADELYADKQVSAVQPASRRPRRNDPCPCGSGKKYKKCCMEKDNAGI